MAIGFLLYAFQGWGIFAEREFSLSVTPDDVKCRARNLDNEGILPPRVRVSYDEGLTYLMAAVIYNDHSSVSAFLAYGDDTLVPLKHSVILDHKNNIESDEILVRPGATPRKKRVFDLEKLRKELSNVPLPDFSLREPSFPPVIDDEKPLCTIRGKPRRKAHQTKSSGTPINRISKESKAKRTRSLPNKAHKKLKSNVPDESFITGKNYVLVRGSTALHIAALLDRPFIASLFIITGNLKVLRMTNSQGNTPLLEALLRGNWDTVFALLKGPLEGEKEQEYRESFAQALNLRNKAGISPLDALLITTANITKQKDFSIEEHNSLMVKVIRILAQFIDRNVDLASKIGPDYKMTHFQYCEQHDLQRLSQVLKIFGNVYFDPHYEEIKNHIQGPKREYVERIINAPDSMSGEDWIAYLQPDARRTRFPRSFTCDFKAVQ